MTHYLYQFCTAPLGGEYVRVLEDKPGRCWSRTVLVARPHDIAARDWSRVKDWCGPLADPAKLDWSALLITLALAADEIQARATEGPYALDGSPCNLKRS